MPQANLISQYYNEFNFLQHNYVVNSNNNTLDLVFSNLNNIKIHVTMEPLIKLDQYHPALALSLPWHINISLATETIKDFKRADYNAINDYLGCIDRATELQNLNINDAVNFLYLHLNLAITSFVLLIFKRRSLYPVGFLGN